MGAFYDHAVARLAEAGFRQLSMRQFRRDAGKDEDDLEYRCQRDGMVGLGAGARSYTAGLHYSTPWRMVARNIRGVVEDYCARMRAGATAVRHGFALDADEQRRRFVIQSLLYDGLDLGEFAAVFSADARELFAEQWEALAAEGCVAVDAGAVRLTARGVRHADVVGQLFFSERVCRLMDTYEYDS
jgi:oxygen-independent coproporphyrinogen-3 oxidase